MRHASAASGGGRDHDRPLTDAGRDEARRVGERLRMLGQSPTRVLSSSARRCRETWAALQAGLGSDAPGEDDLRFDDALYDATADALLEAIREVDASGQETLLVLAHNPGISLLGLELGRAAEADTIRLREGFTPATVAVFGVEGDWPGLTAAHARLLRFERPPRPDAGEAWDRA